MKITRSRSRDGCIDLANTILSEFSPGLYEKDGDFVVDRGDLLTLWETVVNFPIDVALLTYRSIENNEARQVGRHLRIEPDSAFSSIADFLDRPPSLVEEVYGQIQGIRPGCNEDAMHLFGFVFLTIHLIEEKTPCPSYLELNYFHPRNRQIALTEDRTILKREDFSEEDRTFCCEKPVIYEARCNDVDDPDIIDGRWACAGCERTVFYHILESEDPL